ncbi:MAG: RDD family protein [Jannaschia sp.]
MTYLTRTDSLPDPVDQPEFYSGILAKRSFAWLVDVALITVLTMIAGIVTFTVGFFLWPLFFLAIGFCYRVATLNSGSATWGMRLMGIELRDIGGERFDGSTTFLHVLGYYASWFFIVPGLASIAAMTMTGRRQGLTDLLLGTAAINRPS